MPAPEANTTRRSLLVATIVACAFFMEMLDSTVIIMALPQMAASFGVGPVDVSLGLTAYMLTLAVFVPLSGWTADRLGARNVFCAAAMVFTLASVLCGLSTSLWEFVGARILQGIGAALMSPVGRIALLQSTDKKDLVRVMNFVTAPGLLGPVIGPPVGGFITEFASWHWIFFLNLPFGMLAVVLAYALMPGRRPQEKRPFDIRGFLLNGCALACLLYGLDLLAGHRGDATLGAVLVATGLAIGIVAIRHALQRQQPLLSLAALRIRSFAVINIGGAMFRLGVSAPTFVMPLFLQVGLGMSASVAGLMILGHTFGDLAMKAVTRRCLRLWGFRASLMTTTLLFGLSIAACALFTPATPVWAVLGVLFVSGLARSLQFTAQGTLQFADLRPEAVSDASTLSSVLMHLVRGFGIAFAAILLNLSGAFHGSGGSPAPEDFSVVLVVIGAATLGSLVWYLRMPHDMGAEVSGHRRAG